MVMMMVIMSMMMVMVMVTMMMTRPFDNDQVKWIFGRVEVAKPVMMDGFEIATLVCAYYPTPTTSIRNAQGTKT